MPYVGVQSAAELIGNTFRLYVKYLGVLIGSYALLGFPAELVQGLLAQNDSLVWKLAGVLVSVVGTLFSSAVLVTIASEICVGSEPALSRAYGRMFRDVVPVSVAGALQGLLILAGMVLLVLPGIAACVFLLFVIPVVVLERKFGMNAILRSRELVSGFFWRSLGLFVVAGVIPAVVSGLLVMVIDAVAATGLGPSILAAVHAVSGAVLGTLLYPAGGLLILLMYYDLRARKEGYDPAQLTQELQA